VFRLLGAEDSGKSDGYAAEKMPPVNVGLLNGALAWRQHDGGHPDGPGWRYFIPWTNEQLDIDRESARESVLGGKKRARRRFRSLRLHRNGAGIVGGSLSPSAAPLAGCERGTGLVLTDALPHRLGQVDFGGCCV
jgi:hypothetical protein